MFNEVRSYSKEDQLKGHKSEKRKPKVKEKRPKKKKNPQLYRGRIIPKKKDRTKITPENYNKMIEVYGAYCQECGYTPVSAHHLVFRSSMGTGGWRNLAPLCTKCHDRAHKHFEFAEYLRTKRAERFGPHFGKDKYALFKEGLIPTSTDEMYERFMKGEEEKRDNKKV
ncbi:HNH endonuclease [Cytobacillus oceanisediminis]|uniref:HNH endonuclease n=1 Tax=Cytobacillus oceanisediminis TaxID=665099 RepID=UPI003736165C